MSEILKISNLSVEVEGKEVLRDVSLSVEAGEKVILMGPNGSGKSSLALVLMGHPNYKVSKGKIFFKGEDVTKMAVNERAKKGMFLSFQNPVEVPGVILTNFIRVIKNLDKEDGESISPWDFHKELRARADEIDLDHGILKRALNEKFSGGEKKKSEVLQMLSLNPGLAILDEPDSGLDIDSLKSVAKGVDSFCNEDNGLLLITHYKRILDYIKPDRVLIIVDGKIVMRGGLDLVDELEKKGYGWLSGESA